MTQNDRTAIQEKFNRVSREQKNEVPGTVLYVHQDQLNLDVFPDRIKKQKPLILLVESEADASFLPFHKKKLVLEWSARRHFAVEISEQGYPVYYAQTGAASTDYLDNFLMKHKRVTLFCMEPAELTPREGMEKLRKKFEGRFYIIPNGFFLTEPDPWMDKVRKGYRMEFFYREIRKKTGYLMDGSKPLGGQWNYDEQNRKSLREEIELPDQPLFAPDELTTDVMKRVDVLFQNHFGSVDGFSFAVNRNEVLFLLEDFIQHRLPLFGPYQDAMASGEPFLFHSLLSPYLNLGIVTAREVCESVLKAWGSSKKTNVSLNSVEGFIRQVIGWREYMRVYYEAMMPEVRKSNHFSYGKPLPDLYWTAETGMKCLKESVNGVRDNGYAHHIQRLMVLGNFSNLTASDPFELFEWFWFGFVDAHEWVVLPNVLGMSTYADGGVLASKPYVAGGNYIRKMSNYCSGCRYKVTERTGDDACPFNYLYWAFVDREQDSFKNNPRSGFITNTWNKKDEKEKRKIRDQSKAFIDGLKRYEGKKATTRQK